MVSCTSTLHGDYILCQVSVQSQKKCGGSSLHTLGTFVEDKTPSDQQSDSNIAPWFVDIKWYELYILYNISITLDSMLESLWFERFLDIYYTSISI